MSEYVRLAIDGFLALGIVIQWLLARYDKKHPVGLKEHVDDMSGKISLVEESLATLTCAVKELAYMRLEDRHAEYMRRGWAHNNEKHVVERLWKAYHAIGGNGTGTQMYREIMRLPAHPPDEGEEGDDQG